MLVPLSLQEATPRNALNQIYPWCLSMFDMGVSLHRLRMIDKIVITILLPASPW